MSAGNAVVLGVAGWLCRDLRVKVGRGEERTGQEDDWRWGGVSMSMREQRNG